MQQFLSSKIQCNFYSLWWCELNFPFKQNLNTVINSVFEVNWLRICLIFLKLVILISEILIAMSKDLQQFDLNGDQISALFIVYNNNVRDIKHYLAVFFLLSLKIFDIFWTSQKVWTNSKCKMTCLMNLTSALKKTDSKSWEKKKIKLHKWSNNF